MSERELANSAHSSNAFPQLGLVGARSEEDARVTTSELRLSIVVPVRNEQAYVVETLEMLLRQDYPRSAFEILVIDGMSTDGTRELVARYVDRGEPVRLLTNPKMWSSAGRNLGVMAATGDVVLVIDGHCELPDRLHFRHVAAAFRQSGADIVGRPQPLTVRDATPLQHAISLARASRLGHHPDSFVYSTKDLFVPAESVGAAYRREVFERLGYFDERFDACEDVDFNYRADVAGLTCFLSTQAKVNYYPRSSLSGLFQQLSRYGRGRVRLARKHPGTVSWKSFTPGAFLLALAACLLWALVSPWGQIVLGLAIAGYTATLLAASLSIIVRHRPGRAAWWLPWVFATIHFGAGVGVLLEWWFGLRSMQPIVSQPDPFSQPGS